MTAFEFVLINPFVGTNLSCPSAGHLQITELRRKDGSGRTVTVFPHQALHTMLATSLTSFTKIEKNARRTITKPLADRITTDFPSVPSAYGLNGPSAPVTVEKSTHASRTEIRMPPPQYAPFLLKTTSTVLNRIAMSYQSDQFCTYQESRLARSLKVVLLRPLICHSPVRPGRDSS